VSTIFFGLGGKIMSVLLSPLKNRPFMVKGCDGDILRLTEIDEDNLAFEIDNGFACFSKGNVKTIINYLQGWLEGERDPK
jgi:hypothetical protein